MNDQERRAEKVAARDRALLAIRRCEAFVVVTLDENPGDGYAEVSGSPAEVRRLAKRIAAIHSEFKPRRI